MPSQDDRAKTHLDTVAMLQRETAEGTHLIVLGQGAAPPPLSPEERRRRERAAHEQTKATIYAEGCGTQSTPDDDWRRRSELQQEQAAMITREILPHSVRTVSYPGPTAKERK
jgi:hypothetical protein